MKIIKRILIVIGSLITLVLIVALFINKNYSVERDATINKPKQQVFDYIKMLKNQDYYAKWNMMDPNMQKSYSGTDGTVGFVAAWDSKVVGKGEQEIKNIKDGDRIDTELRFYKPMKSTGNAYMVTEDAGNNETKVRWVFYGSMPYPMNIMKVFMNMDKELGPDLQTGLDNLKGVMEKQS